mgnify:CR=1 FL=1
MSAVRDFTPTHRLADRTPCQLISHRVSHHRGYPFVVPVVMLRDGATVEVLAGDKGLQRIISAMRGERDE